MSAPSGQYLNCAAVCSAVGAVRVCQLVLLCAVVSLVVHSAGFSAPYGWFCVSVWISCFSCSTVLLLLEVLRLDECLSVSWVNLKVALASLSVLLMLSASVVYPLYVVRVDSCAYNSCEVRNTRIAVIVCSCAACVMYVAQVFLSRGVYMASACGVLKVVQVCVSCVLLVILGRAAGHWEPLLLFCVSVFSLCCSASVLQVVLVVSGRTLWIPFKRLSVVLTLLAVLLSASAAVVWTMVCFHWSSQVCSWDVRLIVALMSFINLTLYIADLICSRTHPQRTEIR